MPISNNVSQHMSDILEMVEKVRLARPGSKNAVAKARVSATREIARSRGVLYTSVSDSWRRHRPFVNNSTSFLDTSIWGWISSNYKDGALERILLADAGNNLTDSVAIRGFFRPFASPTAAAVSVSSTTSSTLSAASPSPMQNPPSPQATTPAAGPGQPSFQATIASEFNDDEDEFPEGQVKYSLHRTYERDRKVVKSVKDKALANGSLVCCICAFDFFVKYGTVGRGFIECHHTVPVSQLGTQSQGTREADLALVCSNCHRMLHRYRPWPTIDQLRVVMLAWQAPDNP